MRQDDGVSFAVGSNRPIFYQDDRSKTYLLYAILFITVLQFLQPHLARLQVRFITEVNPTTSHWLAPSPQATASYSSLWDFHKLHWLLFRKNTLRRYIPFFNRSGFDSLSMFSRFHHNYICCFRACCLPLYPQLVAQIDVIEYRVEWRTSHQCHALFLQR